MKQRLAGPAATLGAALFFGALGAWGLRVAWHPPLHTYFEYVPIGIVLAILVWDRLFPSWRETALTASCDTLVVVLTLMRVFVPPLPFVSGHALLSSYAAATARNWPLRVIALLVLAHVVYTKLSVTGGWRSMLGAFGVTAAIALFRRFTGLGDHVSRTVDVGNASDIERHLERFTRAYADAFLIIEVPGQDDAFLQFTWRPGALQMDYPLITDSQASREPAFRFACAAIGRAPYDTVGSRGDRFLDCDLSADPSGAAADVRRVLELVFSVRDGDALRFIGDGLPPS